MKKIKLKALKIGNFKGIRELEIDFDGKDICLVGTNETGKTTVFDAFRWLLFDKDSQERSMFSIKPLDSENNEIHKLNSIVTGLLEIEENGETKTLKLMKDYHEVWTKSRGSSKETFDGHTTDYFLDGVPVKKKEYDETINNLIDEDIFKAITDPLHVGNMHWQDQRELLFSMTDMPEVREIAELAAEKEEAVNVERLCEELDSPDDVDKYEKKLKSSMNKINGKLEELPARIDEVKRSMPEEAIDSGKLEELKQKRKSLISSREGLQEKLLEAKSTGAEAEIRKKINETEAKINEVKEKKTHSLNKEIDEIRYEEAEIQENIRTVKALKEEIEKDKEAIEELKEKREDLLEQYEDWKNKNFPKDSTTCPVCEQRLPQEQIKQHRAEFNQEKSQKMEQIVEKGKKVKKQIKEKTARLKESQQELAEHKSIEKLEAELEQWESRKTEKIQAKNGRSKEEAELLEKQKELKKQLEEAENQENPAVEKYQERIAAVDEKITEVDHKIAAAEGVEKAKERLEELQAEEKQYVAKYEELEQQLFELEEFMLARIELIQQQVNEKFDLTNWKLFEVQVNGGINQTCEPLSDGVPWSDMNTGSKFQVGMDIINTLTDYYGYQAPVFIDNRERVAKLPMIESQTIHLVMKPDVEELKTIFLDEEETVDEVLESKEPVQETLF